MEKRIVAFLLVWLASMMVLAAFWSGGAAVWFTLAGITFTGRMCAALLIAWFASGWMTGK